MSVIQRISFNVTLLITGAFAVIAGASPNYIALISFAALWSVGVGGNLPVDSAIFLGLIILDGYNNPESLTVLISIRICTAKKPISFNNSFDLVGVWAAYWELGERAKYCIRIDDVNTIPMPRSLGR